MGPYDLFMIVVLTAAILFGLWKGLAWQVASLAAIIVSYFVAIQFKQPLTNLMKIDEPWAPFLSMLILYLGTSLVIWIGFGYVRQSIKRMHLKEFDSQSGALLGAVKGAILCMVITMFAVTLLGDNARRLIVQSRSGGFIAKSINQLNAIVPNELHPMLDPLVNKFNEKLAKPLPPVDPNASTDGWFGTLTTNSKAQANPQSGFFGQFSTDSNGENNSKGQLGTEIVPGVNVQVDSGRLLDRFGGSNSSGKSNQR